MKPAVETLQGKRVAVTGASGFLGSEVCKQLSAAGATPVRFSRDPRRSPPGTRNFSPPDPPDLSGCDAVVHLAGESILGAWDKVKKGRILRSRVEGTMAVAAAMGRAGAPKVLVCASGTGFYGDRGEEVLTEGSAAGRGFLAEVCRAWEAAARSAEPFGARVATVRLGMVADRAGGAMKLIGPAFRAGLGGRLGSGRQWMPMLHRRDAAAIFLHLLAGEGLSGAFNASVPEPFRNEDFRREVSASVNRPALLHAPASLLRLALGELSSLLLDSQRVLPSRLLDCGFCFTFPDLRSTLRAVFH